MPVNWPVDGPKVEGVHRVALVFELGPTWSQLPGGRLEVSHVCHEKLSVNLVHLVLRSHAENLEPIYCRLQGPCCGLHPPPLHF